MNLVLIISTCVGLISLLLNAFNTYLLSKRQLKSEIKEGQYKRAELFLKYHQFFIDDPRLISMMDHHPLPSELIADPLLPVKRRMTHYNLLNVYEIIYHSYQEHSSFYHEALWRNILRRLVMHSTELQQVIDEEVSSGVYPEGFRKYLMEIKNEIAN